MVVAYGAIWLQDQQAGEGEDFHIWTGHARWLDLKIAQIFEVEGSEYSMVSLGRYTGLIEKRR